MSFYRLFVFGATAIAVPLLVLALFVTPILILGPFLVPVGTIATALAMALVCTCPFALLVLFMWVRSWLRSEVEHIKSVGKEAALWSVSSHLGGNLVTEFVTLMRDSADTGDTSTLSDAVWSAISVDYSDCILWLHSLASPTGLAPGVLLVSVVVWWVTVWRWSLRILPTIFWTWVAACCVVLVSPAEVVSFYAMTLLRMAWYLTPPGWASARLRLEWLRMWIVCLILDCALYCAALNADMQRHYSERLAGRRRKVGAIFRVGMMRTVQVISNMRLPEFIRNRFTRQVGLAELERGREILKELGWPVNVNIADKPPGYDATKVHAKWAQWHVADTDFATGIRQMKLHAREALQDLSIIAPAWHRTEEYRTHDNEVAATARYFQDRHVDFSVDILDDVWDMVRPIFAGSRLTKFGDIIFLLEKKYALGFWMTTDDGRKKLSRRSFIARIGYPAFKQLWARTFLRAAEIMPVAHISVKDEALSPLKYMANKVRTIVGSPLSHYIGSTVFNHWPNHNFQYEHTPIKVGMPLNGFHMGKLFAEHARFQLHAEGDFSEFDSTIEGPIKHVIRGVRKRGYVAHKDYPAICDLIDAMYDQVDQQFLGLTSSGQVFRKGSGLTTGHSSTSMDNSLALVTFYLAAWKELTGLSAREFRHFNQLSCFGDDHMLSTLATAPRAWTARNIQRCMARWGVVNNLVNKKLQDMTFLSKHNSPVTPELFRELKNAGVQGVTRAIWHDKQRLVGKLTAKLKSTQPTYRATRLMSYLQLTAHHPEVYRAIVRELGKEPLAKIVKNNWGGVPSYNQIVRNWYRETHPEQKPEFDDPDDQWEQDGRLVVVGHPSLLDHVLQTLSMLPDLLNPVFFNYGPTRAVVGLLSPHLQWVPTLIQLANGIHAFANLDYHLKRTPYSWLDPDLVLPQRVPESMTNLLVRHWLYLAYVRWRPKWKAPAVADWLVRKSADLAFLAKGQVITDLPRDPLQFDHILVAALLSWVHVPGGILDWIGDVPFPDVASMLDVIWNRVLAFVWTSVPPNFGEVDAALKQFASGVRSVLVEAPTGTGKSTAFIAHLALSQPVAHRKTIVVVPRSLLVVSLRDYVSEAFGLHCTGGTAGENFDPTARVWYMTPQSFLGHLHLVKAEDLVVVDECHVHEPLVHMLAQSLPSWGFRTVLTTATPSASNLEQAEVHVSVPIAQVYKSEVEHVPLPGPEAYVTEALGRVNALPRHVKALVIFDTPEQCENAAKRSHYPVQVLSSRHPHTLQDVPRYFATSVVDVGITIPGLACIVSPNWSYGGRGVRYALSDSTMRQRRGRVGRTSNGVMVLMSAPGALPDPPAIRPMDAWAEALAAGVSPILGWRLDASAMADLFGLDTVSKAQQKDFARVSHIFLSNFRRLKALELEQEVEVPASGQPAVLIPTGSIGHFSGSAPQDLSWAHEASVQLLSGLLKAIQKGDQVYHLLQHKLANVRTGPLYRVANVLLGLSNDPAGWRPELKAAGTELEDPDFDDEIKRMHELLDSLKLTQA